MIKATGTTADGTPFLLLGISGENVTRMVAGEPIAFNLQEVGLPALEVAIIYGKTEAEIADQLKLLMPPDVARHG